MIGDAEGLGPVPDTLSGFLEAARANQFATFANKHEWVGRLVGIDELFVRVSKQWLNPKDP